MTVITTFSIISKILSFSESIEKFKRFVKPVDALEQQTVSSWIL
jgi:hypothetical protein